MIFTSSVFIVGLALLSACTPKKEAPKPAPKVFVAELQRLEIQSGNGEEASPGKKVDVHFVEMNAHGKVLKSTRAEGKPAHLTVDPAENPPGVGAWVVGMRVGGRRRITVPYGAKYGNSDPSGEPLVYEIDLVSVK